MSRVAIILVNWNSWQDTVECLESLLLLEYPDFRIVVCDNGSSDDSLQEITHWLEHKRMSWGFVSSAAARAPEVPVENVVTIIDVGENRGFAAGSNAGIRFALKHEDCSYVWLLNNDTVVSRGALAALVTRVESDERTGMCGSTVLYADDQCHVQAQGGAYYCKWLGLAVPIGWGRRNTALLPQKQVERFINYVSGASLLVTRRFIEEIGLLSEDYFLYFEELDWALRAKGTFRCGYNPDSIVYHKVGRSIGTSSIPGKKSLRCEFWNIRNRLYFSRKFFPYTLPTVSLLILCAVFLHAAMGRWGRAKMILHLFGAYSRSIQELRELESSFSHRNPE